MSRLKVIILYASVTGNAKGMARILNQFFGHYGVEATMGQMQQTDAKTLTDYDGVVIATYTWSGGTIPEETEDFYADVAAIDYSAKPLVFGVVGTGDRFYCQDYNTAPEQFEATLAASGAIKGATSVKVEQAATKDDMPAFKTFTESMLAKMREVVPQQ